MKYFIIAGEASGDLHGSKLIRELRAADQGAEIRCWGGEKMQEEGATLLTHYRELAIMGFWEVLVNLRKISANLKRCRKDILDFNPDVVVLIDYPGFNLRIAKFLKGRINNVYYYISPKVWAWKESRVKMIKEYIQRMYVIFPFETEFYNSHGYPVKYYGNPLVDIVKDNLSETMDESEFRESNSIDEKPVIALLAGSRIQEVEKMLPEMVAAADYYMDYNFVVAGVRSVPEAVYKRALEGSEVKLIYDQTYNLLRHSVAAVVTSGTATLETALTNTPQVVCYKGGAISYLIAKQFVKVRFISLVNLIMDKEIVKELIQNDMTARKIADELGNILPGGWKRARMKADYSSLASQLSEGGAARRVAIDIYNSLRLVNNVN